MDGVTDLLSRLLDCLHGASRLRRTQCHCGRLRDTRANTGDTRPTNSTLKLDSDSGDIRTARNSATGARDATTAANPERTTRQLLRKRAAGDLVCMYTSPVPGEGRLEARTASRLPR